MANHNTGPGLQSGGMTVYYFQPNGNVKLTAFKKVSTLYILEVACGGSYYHLFVLGIPHVGW